jgi:hypothetical protein
MCEHAFRRTSCELMALLAVQLLVLTVASLHTISVHCYLNDILCCVGVEAAFTDI